jgi:hypothetical protein
MEFKLIDENTAYIDFWGETFKQARAVRPVIWDQVMAHQDVVYEGTPDALAVLRDLFISCRIDMARALRAMQHKGDLRTIPVDPDPEFAESNELQLIRDENANRKMVFEVLEKRYGITRISDYETEKMDLYNQVKIQLDRANKLRPGLEGI